jgi:hypothetical protein
MMNNPTRRILILNLLLVAILGGVYANTLAPDITWANAGADGADLITATYTGGVPHPSGYPTYMLLARLFQLLPFGNLAWRTNLMSAVFAILTVLLVSALARRSVQALDKQPWLPDLVGFLTGLAFGLSSLFWSQAVITEVYTLHTFFIALILWLTPFTLEVQLFQKAGLLYSKWLTPFASVNEAWIFKKKSRLLNSKFLDCIGGLVFGLALGNQLTVAFLLPVWLLMGVFHRQSGTDFVKKIRSNKDSISIQLSKPDWMVLARRAGWLGLGLLVYVVIPIRARSGSPVIWGDPIDWEGFWWLVSGQMYQDRVLSLDLGYLIPRLRNWAGWLLDQFGFLGLLLGFFGLLYGAPRFKRFYWITAWIFLIYSVFAVGYNSSDSYVLLIPAYLAFALWFGLGVAKLLEYAAGMKARLVWVPLAGLAITLAIGLNARNQYSVVDASQDNRAVDFATQVLEDAPQDAILFVRAGEDVFTLRYYTFVEGQRPDIATLSGTMVFDWYQASMRQNYPGLQIPQGDDYDHLKRGVIDGNHRPICDVFWDQEQPLECQQP